MIDPVIDEILDLSRPRVGARARVNRREQLLAEVSKPCFADPPAQPPHLRNHGFGLVDRVAAVVPFCISQFAQTPTSSLASYPQLVKFLTSLDAYPILAPYPILAGSAIFLGANHEMCDDLDLVTYVELGTRDEERRKVGSLLRRIISDLQPNKLTAKQEDLDDHPPSGKRGADDIETINFLLDELVGDKSDNPDPELVRRLQSVQLVWSDTPFGFEKPISLQLHFVHSSTTETDIHPHQELHECDANGFFHTNRHWLTPSFYYYFKFLCDEIKSEPGKDRSDKRVIKAAKRAVMLLGLFGRREDQVALVKTLSDHPQTTQDQKRFSIDEMKQVLRFVREDVVNEKYLYEGK